MTSLKKGEVTQTPVKTQYGYHVIKLEDVRPAKVPALADVKQQISESLQQRRVAAFRDDLMKKAKIQ